MKDLNKKSGGRKRTRRKTKRKTKRKRGGGKDKKKSPGVKKKSSSVKNIIPIAPDLHLLRGDTHVYQVEVPDAPQGDINNMAKLGGPGPTPTYDTLSGTFK